MQRRDFFRVSLATAALILTPTQIFALTGQPTNSRKVSEVSFPQKKPLITYSDRPPLLETPRGAFTKAITDNNEFFVRWHSPKIPTQHYLSVYRLSIHGDVNNPLSISMESLKNDYEQVEITTVLQCGGNSRSAFKPQTSGIQWGSGAMGCAKFKGVRLKDILKKADLKDGASWLGLNGSDSSILPSAPSFSRELEIHEVSDDVIVAYEMNGEELPFLNGYPLRLIIPGMYSDSWVKMLTQITVSKEYKEIFFMDTAYRIPDNECECETPDTLAVKTKPITTMNVKSLIGYPTSYSKIDVMSNVLLKGVAFDSGSGIKEVLISLDNGKTWNNAELEDELSLYAFRVFKYAFKPMSKGKLTIMAKAVNRLGEEQPFSSDIQWNHGGYKYNGIDSVTIKVG